MFHTNIIVTRALGLLLIILAPALLVLMVARADHTATTIRLADKPNRQAGSVCFYL
jgi:hypothetical protein